MRLKFEVTFDVPDHDDPQPIECVDIEEALRPEFADAVHDPVMDINVADVTEANPNQGRLT